MNTRWRRIFFVPILKKTGQKGVRYTGGASEQGIDLEYYEISQPDKKRKYTGIQFKKRNLTYGATGNRNTVKQVRNQAKEAFDKEIYALDSDSQHKLHRFICAVTGEINDPARTMIGKAKREKGGQIDFWDRDYLCQLIRGNWLEEFIDYFQLIENDVEQAEEDDTAVVVDDSYIEENYARLIGRCQRVKRTVEEWNWNILKATAKIHVVDEIQQWRTSC
jgi:hypothetical protein